MSINRRYSEPPLIVVFAVVVIVAVGGYIRENTVARVTALPQQNTTCELKIYDINGNSYRTHVIIENYEGSAPLFFVDAKSANIPQDKNGCFEYPDQIDVGLVQQGKQVHPIYISGKPDKDIYKIFAGESFGLTLQANILDKFDKGSFPLILEPNQRALLDFTLSAPSFDIAPSADESKPVEIGFELPAKFTWILHPKENALGFQKIQGEIRGSGLAANIDISIEVKIPLGIRWSVWLVLGIISTVVVFVISNWDNVKLFFADTKAFFRNLFKSRKKK